MTYLVLSIRNIWFENECYRWLMLPSFRRYQRIESLREAVSWVCFRRVALLDEATLESLLELRGAAERIR